MFFALMSAIVGDAAQHENLSKEVWTILLSLHFLLNSLHFSFEISTFSLLSFHSPVEIFILSLFHFPVEIRSFSSLSYWNLILATLSSPLHGV